MKSKKDTAISLLEEVIENLENSKVSLFSSIQKLNRIGKLLSEEKLIIWTEIQMGNQEYTTIIQGWINAYLKNEKEKTEQSKKAVVEITKKLVKVGINLNEDLSSEELNVKSNEAGGGFLNIGFVEEKYNDFVKNKKGNDSTFYKSNLYKTLTTIKTIAYKKASFYHKKYAYEHLPESNFEILKNEVEDVLFDIDPELTEQLLLAFKSISSKSEEEWSQGLTSCRRFLENLADKLYPPSDEKINGRSLSKENYINRIWAFMDKNIESSSNKDLAKKHVDYLGLYLQSTFKLTNKGVHSKLTKIESIKTVMHIYLLCGDLLGYLTKESLINRKINIYSATLDELESIGKVSRKIGKEIIKLRVNNSLITEKNLESIPGIGTKTLKILLENISINRN